MNSKAGYNNLARAALEGAGGTIIAIARSSFCFSDEAYKKDVSVAPKNNCGRQLLLIDRGTIEDDLLSSFLVAKQYQ
jgi:hypothetical protein